MVRGARIAMPIDSADILTLAQWLSPAYPVGAFSYSHGLETAISDLTVTDPESLFAWVAEVLKHGSGRADALLLAAAFRCDNAADLAEIDATCRAFAPARERLLETELQGTAFAQTTAAIWQLDLPALCYPVAVGRAARLLGLPQGLTSAMYLQAFSGNIVSAGIRLVPLGQTDGQRLIRQLAPLCGEIADATQHGDLGQLSGTAFLADIAAMRHETQHTRIFRT